MDFGLKGKRAFIGGGGRGIGKAIAIELAKEGVDLVIASRTIEQLEQTANEIKSISGTKVYPLRLDVTDTNQVNDVFLQTEELLGGLDILVNSASLPGGSPTAVGYIEALDETELMNDFDVKFVGALRCSRAAIPLLKKTRMGPDNQYKWREC
jgi:NAD(P)-dependent dehydrogenase (short-subunit alcohol dehydrogenase family)